MSIKKLIKRIESKRLPVESENIQVKFANTISKDEALMQIFRWLYENDNAYDSALEWREELSKFLIQTIDRIKD